MPVTAAHAALVEFGTAAVVVGSVRVVVTGSCVRTSRDFKLVAHTVAIGESFKQLPSQS